MNGLGAIPGAKRQLNRAWRNLQTYCRKEKVSMHNARETHSGRCLFGKFSAARSRYKKELLKAVHTLKQGDPKRRRNRLSRLRRKRRRHENRVSTLVAQAAGAASQAKSERQRSTKLAKLVKWAGNGLDPAPLREMLEVAGAAVQHRLLPPSLLREGQAAVSAGGRALRNLGTIKTKLCQSATDPFFEFNSGHVKRCLGRFGPSESYLYVGNGTFTRFDYQSGRSMDSLSEPQVRRLAYCIFRLAARGGFSLRGHELPRIRGLRPEILGLPSVEPVFSLDGAGEAASAVFLRPILGLSETVHYTSVAKRFIDVLFTNLVPACSPSVELGPQNEGHIARKTCDLRVAVESGKPESYLQGYILADGGYRPGNRSQWVSSLGKLSDSLLASIGGTICREPTDGQTVELANLVSLTNNSHLKGVMFDGEPFRTGVSDALLDAYSNCRVTSQKVTSPSHVVIALLTAVLLLCTSYWRSQYQIGRG